MHFSALDKFFWAAGLSLNLALLLVLLIRGRWREFPILAAWLAFLVARTILLLVLYIHSARHGYILVYMSGLWIDFALQLGIAVEIARIVLRPTGTWVQDARGHFLAVSLAGVAVAALFAWWVSPPGWSARRVWEIRGNLFTSLVICEIFVAMAFTANRLGLGWRNHVMAIGQGVTAWSAIMVLKTALESFFGTRQFYTQLEDIRSVTYIAAVIWMALQLWRDEPARGPISEDLQQYILALHSRVEYDLRRLDARH